MDLNPGLTLWTAITFLVLIGVLWKFAFGPISRMLGGAGDHDPRRHRLGPHASGRRPRSCSRSRRRRSSRPSARPPSSPSGTSRRWRPSAPSSRPRPARRPTTWSPRRGKSIQEEKKLAVAAASRRGGRPGRRGGRPHRQVEPGREDAATARRRVHQGPPRRTGLVPPGSPRAAPADSRPPELRIFTERKKHHGSRHRNRRTAQRRQVDPLQRAPRPGTGPGRELPVLHHRPQRGGGAGAGRAAGPAGRPLPPA